MWSLFVSWATIADSTVSPLWFHCMSGVLCNTPSLFTGSAVIDPTTNYNGSGLSVHVRCFPAGPVYEEVSEIELNTNQAYMDQ